MSGQDTAVASPIIPPSELPEDYSTLRSYEPSLSKANGDLAVCLNRLEQHLFPSN